MGSTMSVKNSNDLQTQPIAQRDRSRSPRADVAKTESDKASTSGESNADIVVVEESSQVTASSGPDVVVDHAPTSSKDDIVVVHSSHDVTGSSHPDVLVDPAPTSSKDVTVVGHDSQAEDLPDSQPLGNPWVENQLHRIVFSSISRGHSSHVMYKRLRYYRAKYEREFERMCWGELDWETSSDDSQQSDRSGQTLVLGAASQ